MHLTGEDREHIHQILFSYLRQSEVQSMKHYIQHGKTSTYEHCMNVVMFSYWMNKKLHLNANERALVTGALLHDFYLYDWHEKSDWHRFHGFFHASRACRNARNIFGVDDLEAGIIESHMWPLTLRHLPKSREAVIVCIADKCCSVIETVSV